MQVQEITIEFITRPARRGSTLQTIDVERNGQPFGQIWTYQDNATTWHPWHAKPLNGEHTTFTKSKLYGQADREGGLRAAKKWMVEQARAV